MAPYFPARILLTAAAIFNVVVAASSFSAHFTLERGIPASHKVRLGKLKERDCMRHRRMLQSTAGVADLPVKGTFDPFIVGLYYTKLRLGTPPKEYYVQIDTGSDVLWVSCDSCKGCPVSSGLDIPLNFFDPGSSSTASLIYCSDKGCNLGIQASDSSCLPDNNQCAYSLKYGDGSGTQGYFVSDLLRFDTVLGGSSTNTSSASIVFGCSTLQAGDLKSSDRAVTGILGFGQQGISVFSQLSTKGIIPKVFSHCLKGDDAGGGILVLGEIVEPNMVYSPLVPSQPHYNLDLQSISVNGRRVPIDPAIFSTATGQGTIVDSGTTLSYLAEDAYDPFINAITAEVAKSVKPYIYEGNQCFLITESINDLFPQVRLNFAGGASMILAPEDYLLRQDSNGVSSMWCFGFQKVEGQSLTILGDVVLKNKIIVYDIEKQRIGWVKYDCKRIIGTSSNPASKLL